MSIDNKKQPTIQKITGIDILKPEQIFLDNGIPVNVIRMGDTAVTRLDLIFEGGRCDEPRPMISDFVSALMREGTFSKSAEEIADSLDYYGSWMGSETSSHNTTLSVYSLNKHFNKIIPVFTDIATAPAFPENKLENLKDVAITRLNNNRQKVTYLASSEFQKRYYGENHNLGKHPEETTIRNINRNGLLNFHKKRIHPANAKIVISGMVDKDILNAINHNLGQIPSTTRHSQSASDKPAIEFHPDKIFVEKKDAVQSAIKIGIPTILRTHPDYIPLRILITALGGYFGSRLMQNIREDKGYTYSISALLIGMRNNSCITISSQCATAYTQKVIEEIIKEIHKLQTEPISTDELERVKAYMRGDLAKTTDTPFTLSDYYCAAITNNIPEDYFIKQSMAIDNITPATLQDMAIKYLATNQMLTIVAGLLK